MGKASRDKGKVGERELAHKLNDLLGTRCRRGVQYSGLDGDDVVGLTGFHVECKRVEKLNLTNAVNQAAMDSKNGETPVLFHRTNKQPWLVTMRLDDLPEAIRRFHSLMMFNATKGESDVQESLVDELRGCDVQERRQARQEDDHAKQDGGKGRDEETAGQENWQ